MSAPIRALSDLLSDARRELPADLRHLKLGRIIEIFHERGFGFLLFLFALPAALPLPGLGVNFIVALPLLLLTAQQTMGRRNIWLPRFAKDRGISREQFEGFIEAAEPHLKRLEFLISPRLAWVTQGLFSNVIGACGVMMALSILVPLPLTNTVPAMGIGLMSLGVLMRDGLAVIAGMLLGLAWIAALSFFVVTLGLEGVDTFRAYIGALL